jgi:hypothetical protein
MRRGKPLGVSRASAGTPVARSNGKKTEQLAWPWGTAPKRTRVRPRYGRRKGKWRPCGAGTCSCPDIPMAVPGEIVPFCAWRPTLSVRSMRDAATVSEPRGWICPRCKGKIVRTFLEYTAAGQRSHHTGDVWEDHALARAGYRCWSAACGWNDWVCWLFYPMREPVENIMAYVPEP